MKDLSVCVGTYMKDGVEKKLYRKCGKAIEMDGGRLSLKIDSTFNFAGCPKNPDGTVWVNVDEPRPEDGKNTRSVNQAPAPKAAAFEDDLDMPF